MLTCGSLFAGIGGFDLGFERAGIKTVWQVEIDEYCRRVLAQRFPSARQFSDIRDYGKRFMLERTDIIAGGFPCQDISNAGFRVGIEGERSGLWKEMYRIIREIGPQIVVVENVAALLDRGMGVVLADLAAIGFDVEWDVLPACAFGAPHERERVWIIAYSSETDVPRNLLEARRIWESQVESRGLHRHLGGFEAWDRKLEPKPRMVRVANGLSKQLDARLGGLGNAIVPQIAEWIGKRIIEAA